MRDRLKDAGYWKEAIAANETMAGYLENSLNQKQAAGDPKAAISANSLLMARFQRCLIDYSVGAPIDGISGKARALLCDWYHDYMKANPPGTPLAVERPSYDRTNRFFSILVLSGTPRDEAARFVEVYDMWDYQGPPVPGHRDRICEAMASYLFPDRAGREATGVNWPEAYGDLWTALAPDTAKADRARHLNDFLEKWYDVMSPQMAAQTGTDKQKNPNYVGYWCLEAAAASVMAGIDDSGFHDHRFYPADCADWARARKG